MKSLRVCLSSKSQLCQAVAATLPLLVVFRPSAWEYLVFFLVDALSFLLVMKLDSVFYTKLFPEDARFIDGVDVDNFKSLSLREKVDVYLSMCRFPKRRAWYATALSFLKVLPASCVIIFFWNHQISELAQFVNLTGILLVVFIYFYGAVYAEAHIFLSNLISRLHETLNLQDVFATVEVQDSFAEFRTQERLVFGAISAMVCILQAIVVFNNPHWSREQLAAVIATIGIVGAGLVARLWSLGQKFLFGGFVDLLQTLDKMDTRTGKKAVALHTDALLARFEKSFNSLLERLRQSEHSMSNWALQESEKSRFRALGEISSLIAHDLSAPLHVIRFCFDSIKENPKLIDDDRYNDILNVNLDRVSQLVTAIRARVKDPSGASLDTLFLKAHNYVLRVLETQFVGQNFQNVKFEVDPALHHTRLAMSQSDLIHVLENIYRNSLVNLIENKIENPQIKISLARSVGKMERTPASLPSLGSLCRISVSDNGTGMSKTDFESFTAYHFSLRSQSWLDESEPAGRKSMGLMLTQRLLEHYKGSMTLREPTESAVTGTCLEVELPIVGIDS